MATECTSNHIIELTNLSPRQHVAHSLLLVKGRVHDANCNRKTIEIRNLTSNVRLRSAEVKKIGNVLMFKGLVHLERGANDITIAYCNTEHSIRASFDKPERRKHIVRLYYVICNGHDGTFQSDNAENAVDIACQRIDLAIGLIQALMSELMAEFGWERKTFQFVNCVPFRSSLPAQNARQMTAIELWRYHAKEFLARETIADCCVKYVGILAGTAFDGERVTVNGALGAGDVAIYGSGCMYSWPTRPADVFDCFRDRTRVGTRLFDDSNGRSTFGGCFATSLGALSHELGHIFDLGHAPNGIMGTDFDYVNLLFTFEPATTKLAPRRIDGCPLQSDDRKDSRLTKVTKGNHLLSKYHQQQNIERTLLSINCILMLSYHKWFNDCALDDEQHAIAMLNAEISSRYPLRLIEFRRRENDIFESFVHFAEAAADTHSFALQMGRPGNDVDVVVVDSNGNIQKFHR